MADAADMLTGFNSHIYVVVFAVAILVATIRFRYIQIIPFLIRNPLLVFLALAATKHIRWRLVTRKRSVRRESDYMLMTIAIVLLVLYLLGFFAFHVTAGLIHIVLLIAVIMFILHFVTGRSA